MKFKSFSHQGVEAHADSLRIPTYAQGSADPNPPILAKGIRAVYPHTWQKSFTTRIEMQQYDAVVLTSRWIRAIVLPDWGMHLYRAVDLATGRDMFHCPAVLKPAHNALRGAYIAGGVEMNFPVGHSVMTCSRVGVYLRKAPGGIQLLFHNIDRRSGLYCAAGFTLANDLRGLQFDQYFHNPNPLPQPWYCWLNAGLTPHRSLRFLFPSPEMLGHFEGPWMETVSRYSWPVHNGVDYSRNQQAPEPIGLFSPAHQEGWFGAWYDDWNFGVVRWAPPWQVAGQKFWTWGNSEEGLLWAKIGGDGELPVPEIQSGRPETQMDRGVLRPYSATSHHEWWMPVSGIGDVQAASSAGAMSVKRDGAMVRVRVSPASDISTVKIEVNGRPATGRAGHMKAGKPVEFVLEAPVQPLRTVVVASPRGTVLEWSAAKPAMATNVATLASRVEPACDLGPDGLVQRGRRWQRFFEPDLAEEHYRLALTKEPANSQAHLQLGLLALENDRPEDARRHLADALAANRWCDQALYLHALACLWSGDPAQARADFTRAAATGDAWAMPAMVQLSAAASRDGDDLQAGMILTDALSREPNHPTLLLQRAMDHRRRGDKKSLQRDCERLDSVLGVSPHARCERRLAQLAQAWTYIPAADEFEDDQKIAVALDYVQFGAVKEAVRLLKATRSDVGRTRAVYLMHWITGDKIVRSGRTLFFGWGREDRQALTFAIRKRPGDAVAHFALGCLLAEQRKFEPAIEHLEKAAQLRKRDSVIRVALARVLLEVGRAPEAVEQLEQGIELRPANPMAWVRLDQALGALRKETRPRRDAAWLEKFAAAGPEILDNEEARQCLARLACDLGQFDRAAELLSDRTFHPYELSHELRDLWAQIHRRKAIGLAMAGQFDPARESVRMALQYPPNLGLGRPHRRFDAPNLYAAGCILEATGDAGGARQYFEQAAEEDQPDPTPAKPWSILAQIRLGHKEEAMARLTELVRQTQACLDAEFHVHLAGQFRQMLSLCRRIEKGYLPTLSDLARMTEANHDQ